jgi:transposase-like protein
MRGKRRKFSAAFKAKVALEAFKERESLAELSERFEVHATMISKWNRTADAAGVFTASFHGV